MSQLPPIPQQAPMTNKDGTPSSIWAAFFRQALSFMSSNVVNYPISVGNGGTGQITQQAAIDALVGSQGAGKYMRSDGTHTTLSSILAADVPTLNQNTSGTALNITTTSNSTLTSLPNLSLSGSQVSGNISGSAANVTGTVAIANGGTGQTTANAALNALLPSQSGNSGKVLQTDGTSTSWQSAASSTVPSGAIFPYAGTTAPSGYLSCDGSAVSRTTYSALFTAISTTYGAGDGSTTFNLPNAQGIFLRGAGSQTIGGISYSGTQGTTQGDQIQGHEHSGAVDSASGATGSVRFVGTAASAGGSKTLGIVSDASSHGTPRVGSETRPANISVLYIIKT